MFDRGEIRKYYEFFCGKCGVFYSYSGRKEWCIKEARKDGWKNTKERGWVCPSCAKEAM